MVMPSVMVMSSCAKEHSFDSWPSQQPPGVCALSVFFSQSLCPLAGSSESPRGVVWLRASGRGDSGEMAVPVCTAAREALADATEALSVSDFAFSEAPGPKSSWRNWKIESPGNSSDF